MEVLPALAVGLLTLYAIACGIAGSEPDAPLWLRWPQPIWDFIAHGWRPRRPDYAKIARLERELGLGGAPARELSPFEEGMKRAMERGF